MTKLNKSVIRNSSQVTSKLPFMVNGPCEPVLTLYVVTREDSLYSIQAASPPVLLTVCLFHNLDPITNLE